MVKAATAKRSDQGSVAGGQHGNGNGHRNGSIDVIDREGFKDWQEASRAAVAGRLLRAVPGLAAKLRRARPSVSLVGILELGFSATIPPEKAGLENIVHDVRAARDGVELKLLAGNTTIITWQELIEASGRNGVPPGATSTVTPGGIERLDPEASAEVEQAEEERRQAMRRPAKRAGQPTATAGSSSDQSAVSHPQSEILLPTFHFHTNPYQPRTVFDKQDLAELAESLKTHGQLVPVLARLRPGTSNVYEIIDGERRWRASKLAGLAVRTSVREATDEQMAEWALETTRRKDLNPIERARAWQRMIDEFRWSQEKLGERFGMQQASVSNVLRILRLDEGRQQRIMSGEIPAGHARFLVPYAKHPEILAEIDRYIERRGIGTQERFGELVRQAVGEATQPMDGKCYSYKLYRDVPIFKPTPEQLDKLRVIEVEEEGRNKKHRRATNVQLWKELQAAHEKTLADKAEKRSAKKAAPDPDKPLTAAQKKAAEAEERDRRKKLDQQFRDRLARWRTDWLQYLCAGELRESWEHADGDALAMRILLWMCLSEEAERYGARKRVDDLKKALPAGVSLGRRKQGFWDVAEVWKPLRDVDQPLLVFTLALAWLWDEKDGPRNILPPHTIDLLAEDLEIDVAAAWAEEQAGPLTEAYFNLHSKDQLAELAKEWDVHVDLAKPKSAIVKLLVAGGEPLGKRKRLPAELSDKKGAKTR